MDRKWIKCITPSQDVRKKMHTMRHTTLNDRVAKLWHKDPEHLPEHVQQAMTVPPSGRENTSPDHLEKRPRTDGVFMYKIPLSAAEVDEYINNARFPYTKQKAQVIETKQKLPLDYIFTVSIVFFGVILPTILMAVALTQESIDLALSALISMFSLVVIIKGYDATNKVRDTTKPTKRMEEIEQQSVDVSQLGYHVPEQAWNIYLYDRENYDEFVALCENMLKVDSKHHNKTREKKQEILDTFYEMSLMRQEQAKREIDMRLAEIESIRRKAEDQERQLQNDIDTAQAEALSEMMLEPLKADLRVMKETYNKEINA